MPDFLSFIYFNLGFSLIGTHFHNLFKLANYQNLGDWMIEGTEPQIELSGFKVVDEAEVSMVKEIIHKRMHRLMEHCKELTNIHVTLKELHKREKSEIYQIQAKVMDKGKTYASQVEDRNLMAAVDLAFDKVTHELERRH